MRDNFRTKRNIIVAVLATLLAGDVSMIAYSARVDSLAASSSQELQAKAIQLKLLTEDIRRAQQIQHAMPQTEQDCERFETSLPISDLGYSQTSAELEGISHQAGLQLSGLSFHPKDLSGKEMTEVALDASVLGDYESVVRFVNGLQRQKNHYVVDELALSKDTNSRAGTSGIRVDLHLRCYFRNKK